MNEKTKTPNRLINESRFLSNLFAGEQSNKFTFYNFLATDLHR